MENEKFVPKCRCSIQAIRSLGALGIDLLGQCQKHTSRVLLFDQARIQSELETPSGGYLVVVNVSCATSEEFKIIFDSVLAVNRLGCIIIDEIDAFLYDAMYRGNVRSVQEFVRHSIQHAAAVMPMLLSATLTPRAKDMLSLVGPASSN